MLYHLREAKSERYVRKIEIRLVRDAMQAVLTAHELGLSDSEALYAEFRQRLQDLGYESTHVGFVKAPDPV